MANQFAALAEPMRTRIVEELARRPMAVGELAALLPVTPAVSQHLKGSGAKLGATKRKAHADISYRPAGLGAMTCLARTLLNQSLAA